MNLSPTATKALSNRGVPSAQLLPNERQRKTRDSVSAEPPAPLRFINQAASLAAP